MVNRIIHRMEQLRSPSPRSYRTHTPRIVAPSSYWKSIGYNDEGAVAMEQLQKDILRYCIIDSQTSSSSPSSIRLGPQLMNRSSSLDVIPPHNQLVPYWSLLSKAFEERMSGLDSLCVERIGIPPQVLCNVLSPSLQGKQLNELSLTNTKLERDALVHVSRFISENTSLQTLDFSGNTIDMWIVADALSMAFKSHPCLQSVTLDRCKVGNDTRVLATLLNGMKHVKTISLKGNNITSEGAHIIAHFLDGNACSTHLHLDDNPIKDDATFSFASALKQNTTLRFLGLNNTEISELGNIILRRALFDTSSLNSVADSNHDCVISIDWSSLALGWKIPDINGKRSWSKERKVKAKTLLALCIMNEVPLKLSYFDEVPLEIMPYILAMIQEHIVDDGHGWYYRYLSGGVITEDEAKQKKKAFEIKSLNRLFHTLKGWHRDHDFCEL